MKDFTRASFSRVCARLPSSMLRSELRTEKQCCCFQPGSSYSFKHPRPSILSVDHSYFYNFLTGYYVYLETSWPARRGYTSTLSSKWLEGSESRCLSFWYSMHGQSVGSIRVYITDDFDVRKLLWLRSGPQGWSWRKASIQINSSSRYKVSNEGCLFACFLVSCLFACLLACLSVCLLSCLFVCMFVCLLSCLLACFLVCLFACLFA